jgi:ATP-dependent Clp protease ATP-binding subunit ClpA
MHKEFRALMTEMGITKEVIEKMLQDSIDSFIHNALHTKVEDYVENALKSRVCGYGFSSTFKDVLKESIQDFVAKNLINYRIELKTEVKSPVNNLRCEFTTEPKGE